MRLFRRLHPRRRPLDRRERGVAMLVVLTWLALMISVVSEFTYGTTVDAAQAANARDELRAHYLARSAVSLARLLIKIQQRYIDPSMNQAKQMLQKMMGGSSSTAGGKPRAGPRPCKTCSTPLPPNRSPGKPGGRGVSI